MEVRDIARSIVNRTGEFGGNVQELAKNILDKRQQRKEFFNQNPEAQKAVNRMKPPMQRAVEFIGKTYLYNPEEKKLFPSSPVHTIQDMMNIQQQRQSGELSEQEARKQLSDKALNMAMVVGELSPSPKAVNNQAARALKMLEDTPANQYKNSFNLNNPDDIDYLKRVFSADRVEDMKKGVFSGNYTKDRVEEILNANLITEEYAKPVLKTQPYKGTNTFYHGTSPDNIDKITAEGFKAGSELPEDAFRSGGYGQMQQSVSLSSDPQKARVFTGSGSQGALIETKIKPGAKIVEATQIEDAIELNDFIDQLKKDKIDAVWIGGGEKELVVINPKVIETTRSTVFDVIDGKKQIQEFLNKTQGGTDDLIKEAQKYKSAEEFVNKYQIEESFDMTPGVTRISDTSETGLYHGAGVTNLKSILNDEKLITNVSKLDSLGEKVISSSGNRSVANSYGVVFELDENIPKRIAPKEAIKGDVYDAFEYRIDSDVPFNKIKSVTIPLDKVDGVNTKIMWDYSGKNPEYISAKELADKFREKGIKVFFDDGTSFSKSQLTDIWNKAMSKVKGK